MTRYRLGDLIGEGGMAQVLAASRRLADDSRHAVAVKRLRPELVPSPSARARLDLEAQVGFALAHPNLVQVYDYDRIGKDRCIVMEHVQGLSLHDLSRQCRLPHDVIRAILLGMTMALSYVHEMGLLHRDVSPRNVLISSAGEVKLTDFGIVKVMDSPRTSPFFKGTAAYASPEALRGQELDPGADLYSLAAVAYELLTGAPPFGQGDPEQIVRRQDPASAWTMPPVPDDVPMDLRLLIVGLLVSAEERTLRSAEDVLVALNLSDEPMATAADIAALVQGCMKGGGDDGPKGRPRRGLHTLFRMLIVLLLGIPMPLGRADAPGSPGAPGSGGPVPLVLQSERQCPPQSELAGPDVPRARTEARARQVPRRGLQKAGVESHGQRQMGPPVMKRARGLAGRQGFQP